MMDIILFIAGLFLFALFLISGLFLYGKECQDKNDKETKYSLLRMFPFELKGKSSLNIILYVLLGLTVTCLCVISLTDLFFKNVNFICRTFSLVLILTDFLFFGMFIIDTSSYKSHVVLASLFYTMTFISFMLFSFWGLRDSLQMYPLWSIIVSFAAGFIILISMFLPMLQNWYRLKKGAGPKGEELYSRGKVFILAFIEWMDIFLYLGLYLLIIIVTV